MDCLCHTQKQLKVHKFNQTLQMAARDAEIGISQSDLSSGERQTQPHMSRGGKAFTMATHEAEKTVLNNRAAAVPRRDMVVQPSGRFPTS